MGQNSEFEVSALSFSFAAWIAASGRKLRRRRYAAP